MARLQQKTQAASPQVQPEQPDIPCAMVLTAAPCSPRGAGLDSPRRLRARHPPTWSQRRGIRTTRLGRPCRYVRLTRQHGHRIPLPTSVTIAKRPSCGSRTGEDKHKIPKNGSKIFFTKTLDFFW